jgi:hypothetical protein
MTYTPLLDEKVREISTDYFYDREMRSSVSENPTIIFVAAQPGAGKSAAANMMRSELRKQGGYLHVDADRMRERIPVLDEKIKPTSQETQRDAGKLANSLRALAIKGQRNIIEEGTLRNPEGIAKVAEMAHQQGYRAELVAVAANREESMLGIYERYEKQHLDPALNPRFVSEDYHDTALARFSDNLAKDADKFDRARVVNREGQTLYDSASHENQCASPYEALMKAGELTDERMAAVSQGWKSVKIMAETRHAPREHLERIRHICSEWQRLHSRNGQRRKSGKPPATNKKVSDIYVLNKVK